ncbi:MAG: ATP-binding protein, partial [Candidatus Promineifilaceae bacterium]
WPNRTEKASSNNLRKTLHRLRQALGDAASVVFASTARSIQFDSAEIRTDATQFEQLIQQANAHPHKTCIDKLTQAVELYRGELLAGLNIGNADLFNEWLVVERERLHQIALTALHQLTEALLANEAFNLAQRYATRQISLEPWHEDAHRQLMLTLAHQGQTHAALKQYEGCRQILWNELGIAPSAELKRLFEQIKTGQFKTTPAPPRASSRRHNLPIQTTPFFGRATEVQRLSTLLQDPLTRWVTLVGEGGIGKSRLSQAAGRHLVELFADGVWFVPLASLENQPTACATSEQIATAIASVLDVSLRGGHSAEKTLTNYLTNKHLLLILDNVEQVQSGATLINELLHRAERLSILCTSREPMRFRAEVSYSLGGLPVPFLPDIANVAQRQQVLAAPSLRLFSDSAQRVLPQFSLAEAPLTTIANICHWVGGNALGIELAASWMRHKSAERIWHDLQQSYTVLRSQMRDLPLRHRSMQTIFKQSWALLSRTQQSTMARLSVFRGGFDTSAAAAIAGVDEFDLFDLVEKSLLRQDDQRFSMHAALRQYSAEQLPTHSTTEADHSVYYLSFLRAHQNTLQKDKPQHAIATIERNYDNIRSAWTYALHQQQFVQLETIISVLSDYFQMRGRSSEALALFASFAASAKQAAEFVALMFSLIEQARFLNRMSRFDAAHSVAQEAAHYAKQIGDHNSLCMSQIIQAESSWRQLHYAEAATLLLSIDVKLLANWRTQAWHAHHLGIVSDLRGLPVEALRYLNQALELWTAAKDARRKLNTLHSIAIVSKRQGNIIATELALEQALYLAESLGDHFLLPNILLSLGRIKMDSADWQEAATHLLRSHKLTRKTQNSQLLAYINAELMKVQLELGKQEQAYAHAQEAVVLFQQVGAFESASQLLSAIPS